MKILPILLLISTSFFGQQNYQAFEFNLKDTVCKSVYIQKTNYIGAPALYIGCDGKMTVNDSLESIKSLLQIVYDKQKNIEELSKKLSVTIAFIQNYNGMVVVEKDMHKYFSGLKKYYKGMGWDFVVNCKCNKCINHKVKK